MNYDKGSIVIMKKNHPCKLSDKWEIIRVGADIKIQCQGCKTLITMPRKEFEKKLKKVVQL
jgi:hypothetical protein